MGQKENIPLFWGIRDTFRTFEKIQTEANGGDERKSYINLSKITAITFKDKDHEKIKIHMECGKEFRANRECLDELHAIINNALEMEEKQ
jgi:ADP-dependent phosphofructokinase/glucokinase